MKRYPISSFCSSLCWRGFGGRAMAQDGRPNARRIRAAVAVTPGGWTLPPPQLGATIIELLARSSSPHNDFLMFMTASGLSPNLEAGGHVNLTRLREAAVGHVVIWCFQGVTCLLDRSADSRTRGVLPKLPHGRRVLSPADADSGRDDYGSGSSTCTPARLVTTATVGRDCEAAFDEASVFSDCWGIGHHGSAADRRCAFGERQSCEGCDARRGRHARRSTTRPRARDRRPRVESR